MTQDKKTARTLLDEWIPEEARQHGQTARAEWRKSVESLLPPGFLEHRRAARREMLLALRSMIDHALNRLLPEDKES